MVDENDRKKCQQCERWFPPSPRQRTRPGRWAVVKFCSVACANKARIADMAPRVCEGCNVSLVRREKEKPGDFNRRRFCSRNCSSGFANSCRDYGSIVKRKPFEPQPPPPPPILVEPVVEPKMMWRPESLGGPYLWEPGMLYRPQPSSLLGR